MSTVIRAVDLVLAFGVGAMLTLTWPPQEQEEKSCEEQVYEIIHHCIDEGGVYPQECFSEHAMEMLDRCDYKDAPDEEEFTC